MEDCCSVCMIRITPLSSIADTLTFFMNAFTELNENDEIESSEQLKSYCALCLGILCPKLCKRLVGVLQRTIKEENYDVIDFNLCISYPISCIIRERLLEIFLRNEKSESLPKIDTNTLKDVAKVCYRAVLEKALNMQSNPQSDFNICINFTHTTDESESAKIAEIFPDISRNGGKRMKKKKRAKYSTNNEFSRSDLATVLPQLNFDHLDKLAAEILPKAVASCCEFKLVFERQPLCIAGRYLKYSRYINQTPWIIDGKIKSKGSVQELISEHLCNDIRSDEVKFSASGREDADVRMLGDGRPFVLQFINPRYAKFTEQQMVAFEKRINRACNEVQVLHLCIVSPKEFEILKQGEEDKKKHYSALCFSNELITEELLNKLTTNSELEITQKTPIRVLHRRPLHDRKRTVTNIETLYVDEHHFQLFLITQAGTYVKEFVHGDFGRTTPSLSDVLGIPLDILELDVEKVDLPWPPASQNAS